MRDNVLKVAPEVTSDPHVLVNASPLRAKLRRRGACPFWESREKHELEDIALCEVLRGEISDELGASESGVR